MHGHLEHHYGHILHFVSDFVRIPHLVDKTMVPQTSEGPWLINNGKLANPWTITNSDERHCSGLDNSQRAVSLRLTCLPSSLSWAVLARQVLKCNWSPRCSREHLSKWLFAVAGQWPKSVKAVSTVWRNIINMCLGGDCGAVFFVTENTAQRISLEAQKSHRNTRCFRL